MDTKCCSKCKADKEVTEFAWKNKVLQTRQGQCHTCRRSTAKQSYGLNKQATIAKSMGRSKEHRARFQDFKKTLKCCVCSEAETICLDFHHLDPSQKDFVISEEVQRKGWTTLMKEVTKCACVCANCHRKIHEGLIESQTLKPILLP